jgi:hypothetical protein
MFIFSHSLLSNGADTRWFEVTCFLHLRKRNETSVCSLCCNDEMRWKLESDSLLSPLCRNIGVLGPLANFGTSCRKLYNEGRSKDSTPVLEI